MNLTKLHGDGRGGNKSAVTPLIGAEIASNWRADASSASLYRETLYGRLWWSIRSFQPLPMDRVPCETTCVSFHRKEEVVEREVEIVNKMLTIQLPPRQPPSDEKFPSCRFSESVLSRRGLHHVAGYNSLSSSYLERGVERERFPLSFGVEYHLSRFLAFHYHLFSFLAGAAFENTIEEDVVSSCPCPAHEKKVAISNTVTRRYSRFVSIFYFLFPDWRGKILEEINGEGLNRRRVNGNTFNTIDRAEGMNVNFYFSLSLPKKSKPINKAEVSFYSRHRFCLPLSEAEVERAKSIPDSQFIRSNTNATDAS